MVPLLVLKFAVAGGGEPAQQLLLLCRPEGKQPVALVVHGLVQRPQQVREQRHHIHKVVEEHVSTIRFDRNEYSVPVRFLRKAVTVKGYANKVEIICDRSRNIM